MKAYRSTPGLTPIWS